MLDVTNFLAFVKSLWAGRPSGRAVLRFSVYETDTANDRGEYNCLFVMDLDCPPTTAIKPLGSRQRHNSLNAPFIQTIMIFGRVEIPYSEFNRNVLHARMARRHGEYTRVSDLGSAHETRPMALRERMADGPYSPGWRPGQSELPSSSSDRHHRWILYVQGRRRAPT